MAEVTNDKLVWIYTNYGLRRITEVKANPEQRLAITKMVVGDSEKSTFDPQTGLVTVTHDYYTPEPTQEDLVHPLASFYFHGKQLDEENEIVTLITDIPANSSGYLINEIGIYEDNSLIAICTCQPIMKPSIDDNYIISINFKLALHSHNLSTIYDRIVLNAESEYLQPQDLEQIQYNILYMEGNLCEQISENSHIIGLNRTQQLEDEVTANKRFSSLSLITSIYNNLATLVGYENLENFWIFDHSKYTNTENLIIDMGYLGEYLSTENTLPVTDIPYSGLCPYFDFTENNFFTEESITNNLDNTYFFVLQHNTMDTDNTILAKSNYTENKHVFEIIKNADNSLSVKVFTGSANNYVTFTTDTDVIPDKMYTLAIRIPYNIKNENVFMMINGKFIGLTRTETGTISVRTASTIGYTSYIVNGGNNPINPINAKVGLIMRAKTGMTAAQIRGFSLVLTALAGTNVIMNYN